MTNRKAIKNLKSFILKRIELYNKEFISKEVVDFEDIDERKAEYERIFGLTFALDMIDSKYHYDVARDMEYSQLIWLHWDKKEEEEKRMRKNYEKKEGE